VATKPVRAMSPVPARPVAPPVLAATLDGGWDRRLSKGAVRPDRVIDLHDHSLAHAHQVLAMAVEEAALARARLLLVITGKGRADRPGRIKGELAHWLDHGSLRRHVAALRPASLRHGGTGAFYLVLKRG
jgi:DNA-nicking Smr family endonuclease